MLRNRNRMIWIGIAVAFIVMGIGGVIAINAASRPPAGVGAPQGRLAPCPDSPNCVSTTADDESQAIEPFPLAGSQQRTLELLTTVAGGMPGSRNVAATDNYLHFEFRSPWLRFVDDVEFLVDGEQQVVHARSASRIGHSDFGVNRKRMEAIRDRYLAALQVNEAAREENTGNANEPGGETMTNAENEPSTIEKSDDEWRRLLTPEQYRVTRQHGTERAFTGPNWDNKAAGLYSCVCCGLPLFSSETKYESGTGWPSFWQPLAETSVETQTDVSFFMRRTEVHCRRCKAHLGHVFEDGPEPTGLRYCMNGVAMQFTPAAADAATGEKGEQE